MRHTAAERAMCRHYARMYCLIVEEGMSGMFDAMRREYTTMDEAVREYATAARTAFKSIVSDIITQYVKEKVIGPALHDLLHNQPPRGAVPPQ